MSGGHFNYQEDALLTIACQLEADASAREGDPRNSKLLRELAAQLVGIGDALRIYGWAASGDRAMEDGWQALVSLLREDPA